MKSCIVVGLALGFHQPAVLCAQRVVTRDSAGVRIVTSPPRSKLPLAFRVGPQLWDVGGLNDDPAQELNRAGGRHAAILSDGGIVVSDVTRLLYYDAGGKYVGGFGRSGGGPGEFKSISGLCARRGDTLQVIDDGQRRTTVVTPTRKTSRIVAGRSAPPPQGCPDAGWALTSEMFATSDSFSQWVHLRGLGPDGRALADLGDFSAITIGAIMRMGVIAAHGNRIALGSAISPSVDVRDTTGRLVQRIRLDESAPSVTPADLKSGAGVTTQVDGKTGASRPLPIAKGAPMTWPAYGQLYYDPLGRLWMEERSKQDATGWWTVFAPSGEAVGRLQLSKTPSGNVPQVIGFGHNAILIRRSDDDGAIHVTAYRLIPTR